MITEKLPPLGYCLLADLVEEAGRRQFGAKWSGAEAAAADGLLTFPDEIGLLRVYDLLTGNHDQAPTREDRRIHYGPRAIDRKRAVIREPSAKQKMIATDALNRLASARRDVALRLIKGDVVAFCGHELVQLDGSWWAEHWAVAFSGRLGQPFFVAVDWPSTATDARPDTSVPTHSPSSNDAEAFQRWAAEEPRNTRDCESWRKARGVSREWMRKQRRLIPPQHKNSAGRPVK